MGPWGADPAGSDALARIFFSPIMPLRRFKRERWKATDWQQLQGGGIAAPHNPQLPTQPLPASARVIAASRQPI